MIGVIETALLARLKAASDGGVLGYRYREIDSLPIDGDERLAERVQQFPSVWTVFGGWRTKDLYRDGSAKVAATWHLIVAAENLRNERATRLGGSAAEVGSYQMILDVVALLAGQRLGLRIDPLEIGDCTSLYTGLDKEKRKVSLFSLSLATAFLVLPSGPAAGDIADFSTFHADWDIPPFGGVGPALPDDAHADLVSHIVFPKEVTP